MSPEGTRAADRLVSAADELCRRRGVPYPPLNDDGEIVGEVPRG